MAIARRYKHKLTASLNKCPDFVVHKQEEFSSVQDMVGIKMCYYEFMCGESIIVDSGMVFV